MGLGKTVQVMALFAYLMEAKGNYGPHLVIVPNAVLINWRSELATWLPSARVVYYVGRREERAALFSDVVKREQFNILVTTYEFIMRDRSRLSKVAWKYCVIDEAQRMKDRQSKLARDLGGVHLRAPGAADGDPPPKRAARVVVPPQPPPARRLRRQGRVCGLVCGTRWAAAATAATTRTRSSGGWLSSTGCTRSSSPSCCAARWPTWRAPSPPKSLAVVQVRHAARAGGGVPVGGGHGHAAPRPRRPPPPRPRLPRVRPPQQQGHGAAQAVQPPGAVVPGGVVAAGGGPGPRVRQACGARPHPRQTARRRPPRPALFHDDQAAGPAGGVPEGAARGAARGPARPHGLPAHRWRHPPRRPGSRHQSLQRARLGRLHLPAVHPGGGARAELADGGHRHYL